MNTERQRFHTLDAMRGIAAVAVMFFHMSSVISLHGFHYAYLSVDFFFMLSGFVIARVYEPKMRAGMTVSSFVVIRLVRLYPLIILGVMLGTFMITGQMASRSPTALSLGQAIPAFIMNALLLPAITSPIALFPFNAPAWSLFFEVLINILFATALYRARATWLIALSTTAGALYFYTGLYTTGGAAMGPAWGGATIGIWRVTYSFTLGIVFCRCFGNRKSSRTWLALIPMAVLAILLATPGTISSDTLFDTMTVFAIFPTLLWFGAKWDIPTLLRTPASFLGDISYPLYAVHYPLLRIFFFAVRKYHLSALGTAIVFGAVMVTIAWFLAWYFDAPIRKWAYFKLRCRSSAMPV